MFFTGFICKCYFLWISPCSHNLGSQRSSRSSGSSLHHSSSLPKAPFLWISSGILVLIWLDSATCSILRKKYLPMSPFIEYQCRNWSGLTDVLIIARLIYTVLNIAFKAGIDQLLLIKPSQSMSKAVLLLLLLLLLFLPCQVNTVVPRNLNPVYSIKKRPSFKRVWTRLLYFLLSTHQL